MIYRRPGFLNLPVCRHLSLLTGEGGGVDGRGAKLYGREKAWSSINNSVLSERESYRPVHGLHLQSHPFYSLILCQN